MNVERSLEELGKIVTGKTPPKAIENAFGASGIPFLTPKDMDNRKWLTTTERYLSREGLNSVKKSLVPAGSISVSCIGSDMGKAAMVPTDTVTNQQINTIIPDTNKCNPDYLYYYLSTMQKTLKDIAGGSATPILNRGHFGKVTVTLPDLSYQQWAAKVLSALDDKIQLNYRINQILEQMAQALFKSWFVDFEPVKAKIAALEAGGSDEDALLAAMEAVSGKTTDQLVTLSAEQPERYAELRATAELFPSAMQNSELGEMPLGWGISRTEELSEKIGMGPFGSNIKVSTFVDNGIPVISGQHLKETLVTDGKNKFITEEHAERLKNSNVFPEDIIFTHAGTIGQVSLIPREARYSRYVISQRQFYLRVDKKKASPYFMVYFFRSHLGQHLLLANSSQVGVPSIARPSSHLKGIELVTPPFELMKCFDDASKSLLSMNTSMRNEIQRLTAVRDTLLPKLLSGELTLPDADEVQAEPQDVAHV